MHDPNILIWPDNHTFEAFERAQSGKLSDKELCILYLNIHSRNGLEYIEAEADALFGADNEVSSDQNIPLCVPREDVPLSIVTVSRNDEHVERMRERSQAFIDGVIYLATKFKTKTELVIVEWNPPNDTRSMHEEFIFPENDPYVSIIILTVPTHVHGQYTTGVNMPLYQMIGKNVGIRRARGRFIVATNIDILFSEDLFAAITSPKLKESTLYRSNRWDVQREILDQPSAEDMIAVAQDTVFQVQYRHGIKPRTVGTSYFETGHLTKPNSIRESHLLPQLHTMACGDFQMLARADWFKVRGYAELDGYSFHLDSLFALVCHHHGIAEYVFSDDFPHFHIDHSLGTEAKSDTYIMQNRKALKHISFGGLIFLNKYMADRGTLKVNRSNWGLSNYPLPVSHACYATWEDGKEIQYLVQQEPEKACLLDLPELERFAGSVISDWVARSIDALSKYILTNLNGRNFYIWGPGVRGQILASLLAQKGVVVSAFIQGGGTKARQLEESAIPVFDQTELYNGSLPDGLVGIATIYAEEVCQVMEERNKQEGKDYFVMV